MRIELDTPLGFSRHAIAHAADAERLKGLRAALKESLDLGRAAPLAAFVQRVGRPADRGTSLGTLFRRGLGACLLGDAGFGLGGFGDGSCLVDPVRFQAAEESRPPVRPIVHWAWPSSREGTNERVLVPLDLPPAAGAQEPATFVNAEDVGDHARALDAALLPALSSTDHRTLERARRAVERWRAGECGPSPLIDLSRADADLTAELAERWAEVYSRRRAAFLGGCAVAAAAGQPLVCLHFEVWDAALAARPFGG